MPMILLYRIISWKHKKILLVENQQDFVDNFGLIHRLSPNNVENVDKIVDKYVG